MNEEDIIALITASDFVEAIFSEREKSAKDNFKKVIITAQIINKQNKLQMACYTAKQVMHINEDANTISEKVALLLKDYRQILIRSRCSEWHILKMGQKYKSRQIIQSCEQKTTHDRPKQYILNDGDILPFLVEQGVMSSNYRVKSTMQHKFRQINRYLEFVRDIVDLLPRERPAHIVDFGCGKSYLTFALYHYLVNILHIPVVIHGLDLKKDVIENCNALSQKLHFNNLTFSIGDIASYQGKHDIDMIVTLHACDTATDYALFQALKWNCRIIFSVPCCQHELNKTIKNELLQPIFKYGIIQERVAALFTDGLRAAILDAMGYKAQILEFIDMEDTPKNLLIRAIKVDKAPQDLNKLEDILKAFNIKPTLIELLKKDKNHA